MPPKKPPSQAGKFKPLKRPARNAPPAAAAASAAGAGSASTTSSAGVGGGRGGGGRGGRSPPRGRQQDYGRGGGDQTARGGGGRHSGGGRGRGGGRGGREGRGQGRGGRGGRFIVPTGQAFFTGEAAKRSDAAGPSVAGGGAGSQLTQDVQVMAGTDGAVFMPGMAKGGSGGAGGTGASSSSSNMRVARSAAESMAAAARAKAGEGEEIIVAEMMDLDDNDDEPGKKKSVLDGPSSSMRFDGLPSLFDDENQNADDGQSLLERGGISDAFMYDSDSSAEERRARHGGRKKGSGDGDRGFRLPPTQLPFPVASHQQTMYDCQDEVLEEKKMSEADAASSSAAVSTTKSSSKLSDPPLQSPFLLDLESVTDELKQLETNPWFLMKFPTRLPHLDTSSATAIKSELSEESNSGGIKPDAVRSIKEEGGGSSMSTSTAGAAASVSTGPQGYDDTLKDAPAGRYGRIVVRKSGKTELIIGGGNDGPEVRLLVHGGLQCGFRQEAVSIDPDESTFVSLGSVDKSLIVTPDVERAFAFS